MPRSRQNLDRIVRTDVAFFGDREICPGALRARETLHESLRAHLETKLETRKAGLGHLQRRVADAPDLPDKHGSHFDAFDRQVLSKGAGREGAIELARPPRVVLDRIRIHRFVVTAVHVRVGLRVAVDVGAADRNASGNGLLPYGRANRTPPVRELTRLPNVDRHEARHFVNVSGSRISALCVSYSSSIAK